MNRKEKTCTTNRSTGFGGKTVSRERSGIALASDATKRKKPALLIVAQVLAGKIVSRERSGIALASDATKRKNLHY